MPRLSFTLRDVFWLTLVVGMGVGWSLSWRRLTWSTNEARRYRAVSEALEDWIRRKGATVELQPSYIAVSERGGVVKWIAFISVDNEGDAVSTSQTPVGQP